MKAGSGELTVTGVWHSRRFQMYMNRDCKDKSLSLIHSASSDVTQSNFSLDIRAMTFVNGGPSPFWEAYTDFYKWLFPSVVPSVRLLFGPLVGPLVTKGYPWRWNRRRKSVIQLAFSPAVLPVTAGVFCLETLRDSQGLSGKPDAARSFY